MCIRFGKRFAERFDDAKSRFFRAFNAILDKTGRCASEPVVLTLLRSNCMPISLYAVEACRLSLHYTRIFIKLFRTGSSKMVNECQVSFSFLPKSQILIRTDSFLQKFNVSANIICVLFANDSRQQLHVHNIFYSIW